MTPAGVQLVLHHLRQAFSISRLVVENGDLLALVFLGDPGRDERGLLIVARVDAHDRRAALFGQDRIRRGRGHHQEAVVRVDVGRGDRRARAGMTVDVFDLLPDDAIGDSHRLLRIAGVVLDHDLDLAAIHAAGVIDRRGGCLRAALHLFADAGDRSGHRSGDGDGDVLGVSRRRSARRARAPPAKESMICACRSLLCLAFPLRSAHCVGLVRGALILSHWPMAIAGNGRRWQLP